MWGSMDDPNLALSLGGLFLFTEMRVIPPGMKVCSTIDGGQGDIPGMFACGSFPKKNLHSLLTLYKRIEYTCNETKHEKLCGSHCKWMQVAVQ